MASQMYVDLADLRAGVKRDILDHPARRASLRRASAEHIAGWLLIGRSTLFDTLRRLGLTLADLQRERV